jgi:hypothetical protein
MNDQYRTPAPFRRARRTTIAVIALAAGSLIAASCGADDDASGASSGGLAIDILTPRDGATTAGSFELAVDASVPFGKPDTGRHHLHVYYDGNTAEGEYDIMYGDTVVIDGLDPGEHTIEAAIANADHSLAGASDTITVEVGDGASSGDSGTAPEPAPVTAPDYGY